MKSKKLLLGSLSAMALVATPIAAVVSCNGNDDAATKDTKIVKSEATGFVVGGTTYIPADLASKAGDITVQGNKLTWTEALKADAVVKFTKKGETTATDQKAKKADADHFVLPLKALNGVGIYGDKATVEAAIEGLLNSGDLNLTLKATDKKTGDISTDELAKLNAFAKAAGSVATKVVATVSGDKTTFAITWTPKTPDKQPVVTQGSTQADVDALKDAFGTGSALTTPAGGDIAAAGKVTVKAADKTMDKTALLTKINAIIKGTGAGIAASGLTNALIKADMKVEVEVKTATTTTVATGAAEITITAGSFHATVAIVLTK